MKIGEDLKLFYKYNKWFHIPLTLTTHPHLLLTGASGSGKSYALKLLIYQLLKENAMIKFCNFKNSEDFKIMDGYQNYFTYMTCANGIKQFCNQFHSCMQANLEYDGYMRILIFDEYPAFILSEATKNKEYSEQYKRMLSEVLMLGRSYGFGVWLVMQRPDSILLANGARDNFQTTISLGNISKEAKSMLYAGESLPNTIYKIGEGICSIDGEEIREIKYPSLSSDRIKKIDAYIQSKLSMSFL